jgi:hypothetical protein
LTSNGKIFTPTVGIELQIVGVLKATHYQHATVCTNNYRRIRLATSCKFSDFGEVFFEGVDMRVLLNFANKISKRHILGAGSFDWYTFQETRPVRLGCCLSVEMKNLQLHRCATRNPRSDCDEFLQVSRS